jgi:hypothetical protein
MKAGFAARPLASVLYAGNFAERLCKGDVQGAEQIIAAPNLKHVVMPPDVVS